MSIFWTCQLYIMAMTIPISFCLGLLTQKLSSINVMDGREQGGIRLTKLMLWRYLGVFKLPPSLKPSTMVLLVPLTLLRLFPLLLLRLRHYLVFFLVMSSPFSLKTIVETFSMTSSLTSPASSSTMFK